jgi:ABC-type Mn2+/Zn2+ transport system ATPase subunit
MKIEITSLRLVNCGPFDDVTIDFSDGNGRGSKTILLAGANGSGKTTTMKLVLEIISQIFKNLGFDTSTYNQTDTFDYTAINGKFNKTILDSADYIQMDMWVDNFNFSFYYYQYGRKPDDISLKENYIGRRRAIGFVPKEDPTDFWGYTPEDSENVWTKLRATTTVQTLLKVSAEPEMNRDLCPPSIGFLPHPRQLHISDGTQLGSEKFRYGSYWCYKDAIEFQGSLASYLIWLEYLKDKSDEYEKTIAFLNSLNIDGKTFGIVRENLQAITILPDGTEHPIAQMSSGEQNIFIILLELRRKLTKGSIILIDEVEDSLHSTYQRKLVSALEKIREEFDLQLILASHSKHVVEIVGGENVRLLARFRK